MMGEVECVGVSSSKWGRKVEVKRALTGGGIILKRVFIFCGVGWVNKMGQGDVGVG